jgi:exodeoxyribonuclease III
MSYSTLTTKPRTPRNARRRMGQARTQPSAAGHEASVLAFNISVAAEERAARIMRWLRRRRDDVIVLSETNGGPGTELLYEELASDGYSVFAGPQPGERGVLIASRLPVAEEIAELSVTVPCRAQGIVLDGPQRLPIIGVYVPSRDRSAEKIERKERFIASLLESVRCLPAERRQRLLLLGDYNVVARSHEPSLPGFFPYEYDFHDELARLGLHPAHELKPYGRSQPHSWIGRTGIGYLYDYAHLGSAIGSALCRCQYLHGPREQQLSDHAALALRLRFN